LDWQSAWRRELFQTASASALVLRDAAWPDENGRIRPDASPRTQIHLIGFAAAGPIR
jgi:hypothetical protein